MTHHYAFRTCTIVHLVGATAALLALVAAPPARAFGPGVHMRECAQVLDALAADDPAWAADGAAPLANAYLGLGAISPDFMYMADALGFGHSLALSHHLLAAAADLGPSYRLFALGNLCHLGSDGSSEAFTVPTFFSSAPLGAFDLIADQGPEREAEGIVESLGDLMTGDWHAVIDTLYDLWLDGPDARARFTTVFAWYCATASAYLDEPTDCALVATQIGLTFDKVAGLLGAFSRAEAHTFVADLVATGPDALVDLVVAGALGGLTGTASYATGPDAERELARVHASALMDPAFWSLYATALSGLGPAFARDFHAGHFSGWPAYDANAILSGTISSHLRLLPDEYAVRTGFMVDDLRWETPAGAAVTTVDAALAGAPLVARLRFFSALPLDAVLHAVVKQDRPGLDNASDPVVGEATLAVAIDPLAYAVTSRDELAVAFDADPTGAVGFYLELRLDDEPRPLFTTNWDRLLTVGTLDFDRPLYRDHYGTYGHWPPSLPVAAPDVHTATLFAKAVRYPAGTGIADAAVDVDDGALTATTAAAGAALFSDIAPGPHVVRIAADGFAPAAPVTVDAADLDATWAIVPLHAIPAVTTPAPFTADPACLPFAVDRAPFGDQLEGFVVEARAAADGAPLAAPVEVGRIAQGELCFSPPLADGTALHAVARARYVDDTLGVEGAGPTVTIDTSPPALDGLVAVAITAPPGCVPRGAAVPYVPACRITVSARDLESGVARLGYTLTRAGVSSGDDASPDADGALATAAFELTAGLDVEGDTLVVWATNGADLTGERSPSLGLFPVLGEEDRCPPDDAPDADANAPDASADADADAVVEVAPPPRPRDGGCGGGDDTTVPGWLALGTLAGLAARRRRALRA